MAGKIACCIDSETVKYPELLGLEGENMFAEAWLEVFSDAFDLREKVLSGCVWDEVWVVSSNSIDGINVAAALRSDDPFASITYVSFVSTGSVVGRCEAANIHLLQGQAAFAKAYALAKQTYRGAQPNNEGHVVFTLPSSLLDANRIQESASRASLQEVSGSLDCETSNSVSSSAGLATRVEEKVQAEHEMQTETKAWDTELEEPIITIHASDYLQGNFPSDPAAEATSVSNASKVSDRSYVSEPSSRGDRKQSSDTARNFDTSPSSASAGFSSVSIGQKPFHNLAISLPKVKNNRESFALAVLSGSGGSGKSTIALSTALIYKELGFNVVLLDADLQFGDMAYMLGFDDPLSITDILAEPKRLARLESHEYLPGVLSAPECLEHSELIMTQMADVIRFVKSYYDIVVINSGSFWTEQHAQIIEASDCSLFVLDQRPSSVRACSRALDLCGRCGLATQTFKYVLNYCSRQALLSSLDVSCALQGVSVHEIKDGGKEVGELLGASLPLELLRSKNPFIQSMRDLSIDLLPDGKREVVQARNASHDALSNKKRSFPWFGRGRVACL